MVRFCTYILHTERPKQSTLWLLCRNLELCTGSLAARRGRVFEIVEAIGWLAHHLAPATERLMFDADPKGRADLKPGTLYAVAGEGEWIYYGQVTRDKVIAFFRRRDRRVENVCDILASAIMSRIGVNYSSIGRALRSGVWKKIGRFELHSDLLKPDIRIQWPVGTLTVTVWID